MILLILCLLISVLFVLYSQSLLFDEHSKIRSIVVLSGDFDWDTITRVRKGVELRKKHRSAKFILCGKFKRDLMLEIAKKEGVEKIIIQDRSTNTYEDAYFLKELVGQKNTFPMLIVTNQPHLRRSLHTFANIFPDKAIYGLPTNDFFNIYSPFLPSGWLAVAINIFKDIKYNGKII
jgi:uncharacterized SAM-binding protein YcdF (DUF218 family)